MHDGGLGLAKVERAADESTRPPDLRPLQQPAARCPLCVNVCDWAMSIIVLIDSVVSIMLLLMVMVLRRWLNML